MITEDPAVVTAVLKDEHIRWPWLSRGVWAASGRFDNGILPQAWDDFEGTEALAREIYEHPISLRTNQREVH
ncbi:MAG: hypothetical protein ACR2RF_24910 [Geminicoccaceae bacterium]